MRTLKKCGALLAVSCLLLCTLLLGVSCNGDGAGNDTTSPVVTTAGDVVTTAPVVTTTGDGKLTYTVTVVDQNGDPVVGAYVQLCIGEMCNMPVATNGEGIAQIKAQPDDWEVTLANPIPAGYTFEGGKTPLDGETEITITVTKN